MGRLVNGLFAFQVATPMPSPTPFPTPILNEDDDLEQIPVTGEEYLRDELFRVISWDAIGDALRNFWERLRTVEIDLTPDDNP